MTSDPLRIVTEAQRERLHAARNQGGQCAGCGRALAADETVYIERFTVVEVSPSYVHAPVGVECASPELLQKAKDDEPERCAGCGRPVYYRVMRRGRHRALCSRPCVNRTSAAERSARATEG
jgi:hypothetical protein